VCSGKPHVVTAPPLEPLPGTEPQKEPEEVSPIDPTDPIPDDPGPLLPDTPETLPPPPIEPSPEAP
jgi:hypothetical protein